MIDVKSKEYSVLINELMGKTVRFISDCELFPGFDVSGKVSDIHLYNSEVLILIKRTNGKKLTIGSNMKNLKYEIIS